GLWRESVLRALLIRISQLEHGRFAVRPAQERDSGRQIIGCKSGRDGERGHIYQKSIENRNALVAGVRRPDALFDKSWLMFHGFVNDGVKPVIRHHLKEVDHQLLSRG